MRLLPLLPSRRAAGEVEEFQLYDTCLHTKKFEIPEERKDVAEGGVN